LRVERLESVAILSISESEPAGVSFIFGCRGDTAEDICVS
jgi:hypothetical protein